jgi:DNA repair exonuclease SbcCD ATPase subunit
LSFLTFDLKKAVEAKLEQIKKAENELQKVKTDGVRIEAELNQTVNETKTKLEQKNVEIQALKSELKKPRSSPPPVVVSIGSVSTLNEKEAEIVQLKARIVQLKSKVDTGYYNYFETGMYQ